VVTNSTPTPTPDPGVGGIRDLFDRLGAPFEAHEIKVRRGPRGEDLRYINARTARQRLNDVLGPENWE
jgi:hypothetical protein